jgi:hypothetical protein
VESKKQFSADGSFLSEKLEKELLLPLTDPASKTIAVFNTSSWAREGIVTIPENTQANAVQDATGQKIPLQKLQDGTMTFLAKNIPALGSATYTLIKNKISSPSSFIITDSSISNGKVTVSWDKKRALLILPIQQRPITQEVLMTRD